MDPLDTLFNSVMIDPPLKLRRKLIETVFLCFLQLAV